MGLLDDRVFVVFEKWADQVTSVKYTGRPTTGRKTSRRLFAERPKLPSGRALPDSSAPEALGNFWVLTETTPGRETGALMGRTCYFTSLEAAKKCILFIVANDLPVPSKREDGSLAPEYSEFEAHVLQGQPKMVLYHARTMSRVV